MPFGASAVGIGGLLLLCGTAGMLRAQGVPISGTGPGASKPAAGVSASCRATAEKWQETSDLLGELQRNPSTEGYNALGAMFANHERMDCSIEAFRQALRLDSSSGQTRYNLALALMRQGQAQPAMEQLHLAIRNDPKFAEAHNALGSILQDLGKLDAAAEEFKTALNINPHYAFGAFNLATVLHAQKKYPAEIYYLEQALEATRRPT